jgi:hypothetical protein
MPLGMRSGSDFIGSSPLRYSLKDDGRHTLVMVATPPPPAPFPPMSTLDAVVAALDSVIEWSIATSSRLGYFAALYDRRGCRDKERRVPGRA